MTRRHLPGIFSALALSLVASLAGGCGASTPRAGTTTPHGGALVDLPEGKGFVEVLKQAAPGKPGRSVVIVYFLDGDRNPMTPSPTSATLKGSTTGDKPVAFKPVEGADAAKAGGLASEPIADRGEIEGELTATVVGGPVTVPVMLR